MNKWKKTPLVFIVILLLLWGSFSTSGKMVLRQLDVFQLNFYMYLCGFTVSFLAVLLKRRKKILPDLRACVLEWKKMVVCGLLIYGYFFFYNIALYRLSAVTASVVNYTFPVFILIFDAILQKRKLTFKSILPALLGLTGVILVVTGGNSASLGGVDGAGILFGLIGALSWGLFSVLGTKVKTESIFANMIYCITGLLLSAVTLLVCSEPVMPTWQIWLWLLWIGGFSFVLSNLLWIYTMKILSAEKAAAVSFLTPFINLLFIAVILKEPVGIWSIAGLIIILGGVRVSGMNAGTTDKQNIKGKQYHEKKKKFTEKKKFFSIRKKIFLTEFLIITATIILLEATAFFFYYRMVEEKVTNLLRQNSSQAMNSVESVLENAGRLTEFPLLDNTISKQLLGEDTLVEPEYAKYHQIVTRREITEALYKGIIYGNNGIGSVELISENRQEQYCIGSYGMGSKNTYGEIIKLPWYEKILQANGEASILGCMEDQFLSDDKTFISVGRKIGIRPFSGKTDAVIKINLNERVFSNILSHMTMQGEGIIALIDQNGNIVSLFNGIQHLMPDTELLSKQLFFSNEKQEISLDGRFYEKYSAVSELYGWSVISLFPRDMLYGEIKQFGLGLLVFGCLLIVILSLLTYFTSASITRPILKMASDIEEIECGRWEVKVRGGNDEIGMLADTLNHMMEELRESVRQIYKKEDEKRQAEMMALQAQINPHFLYNTLGAIRFMADVQGADNVVEALNDLIELFRAVSHMEGDFVTIQEDLKIIQLYSEILMIRYMERFQVEYEIQEELLSCHTIKFLLQPLLENAILHGFQDETREGLIRISIREEDENIVFEIYDNGCGMDEASIRRVLHERSPKKEGLNKIGIINVMDRIQMNFGNRYGLTIESQVGVYTKVKAVIPKRVSL